MSESKYRELKAKIAELEQQAEAARRAEVEAVVSEIREKVAVYGLTAADIFGRKRNTGKTQATVPAKYRNPKTGEEWSGRGRAPAWIKDVKNRDRFLIDG